MGEFRGSLRANVYEGRGLSLTDHILSKISLWNPEIAITVGTFGRRADAGRYSVQIERRADSFLCDGRGYCTARHGTSAGAVKARARQTLSLHREPPTPPECHSQRSDLACRRHATNSTVVGHCCTDYNHTFNTTDTSTNERNVVIKHYIGTPITREKFINNISRKYLLFYSTIL